MSKRVTFSEECFANKKCPKERPHCIKTTTGEEGKNIVGNCGEIMEFNKWQKKVYKTNENPYNYGGYYSDKGFDPGKFGEYDMKGELISVFTNPLYEQVKRRNEWWKGGKKKKRTRKRRRKKRRRTRKRRRKKRRRTRK
jgi:hypothetical protein